MQETHSRHPEKSSLRRPPVVIYFLTLLDARCKWSAAVLVKSRAVDFFLSRMTPYREPLRPGQIKANQANQRLRFGQGEESEAVQRRRSGIESLHLCRLRQS